MTPERTCYICNKKLPPSLDDNIISFSFMRFEIEPDKFLCFPCGKNIYNKMLVYLDYPIDISSLKCYMCKYQYYIYNSLIIIPQYSFSPLIMCEGCYDKIDEYRFNSKSFCKITIMENNN